MADDQKQIHFSPLDDLESLGCYRIAAKSEAEFKCWIKGETQRYLFSFSHFYESNFQLELKAKEAIPPTFSGKVLFSFESKGVQYFSTGEMIKDSRDKMFNLKLPPKIYKCERRKNFRLSVYPNKNVKCYFDLKTMKRFKGGDVVSIQKNELDEQKVLESFSELVKTVNGVGAGQFVMSLRVEDVSVTGIALHVGVLESEYFETGHILNKFLLIFDKKQYEIPKAKIAYLREFKDPRRAGIKMFKVGLQFQDVSESLDNALSAHLAQELRHVDLGRDFEDFIK